MLDIYVALNAQWIWCYIIRGNYKNLSFGLYWLHLHNLPPQVGWTKTAVIPEVEGRVIIEFMYMGGKEPVNHMFNDEDVECEGCECSGYARVVASLYITKLEGM